MLHKEESRRAVLDVDEQEIMDHILAAMEGIIALGLKMDSDNLGTELTLHVHGLQGFVIQHMLQRVERDAWGKWYA
jgi:hypothetical protein